jgi:hypothetical protein
VRDRLAEEILRQGHDHECCDRAGTGGFAEQRHPRGIAAEGTDLLLHPAQRSHLVEQGPVGRGAVEFGVSIDADPVIGGDHDDPGAGECRTVIPRFRRGSEPIVAAVDPCHHG